MDIFDVVITKQAKRDLIKVPFHIVKKLQAWIDHVVHSGLKEIRKIPGYHDEPLHGKRVGERSIRLSKAYRAIYTIKNNGSIEIVMVLEVNKHDY
jgi:proteic killer suppression protein